MFGLRKKVRAARAEAERMVPDAKRMETVNSFGRASAGVAQVRGNGTLALDDTRLVFIQWIPHNVVDIPLNTISIVDTARDHLGKSVGTPLLRVRFVDGGQEDIIAFHVKDRDGWLLDLQHAARDAH